MDPYATKPPSTSHKIHRGKIFLVFIFNNSTGWMSRGSFTANAKQFDVVSLHVIFFMRLLDACFYGCPASSSVYAFFSRGSVTLVSRK